MMYLPAATFPQSVTVIERHAHHSDDVVLAAIHCCQREWVHHSRDKMLLARLYQALFSVKWSWHYILDLPHNRENPGVQAYYAQIELAAFAKTRHLDLNAISAPMAQAHISSFLGQSNGGAA